MAKVSQLEKAIAAIDAEIAVLQNARVRLVAQRPAKVTKEVAEIVMDGIGARWIEAQ